MHIIVKQAKDVARQWVMEAVSQALGFSGAFLHGSINWLADDALMSAASDVDVMVVLEEGQPPITRGKFIYQGVLLEASYLSSDRLQSPEEILGDYQLASSFRVPGVLLDPTGHLTQLQAAVSQDFAKREWVRRRCEDVRRKIQRDLHSPFEDRVFPDEVLAWLFGTGKTTHLPLVAGLKNPTVRRRYAAVRDLLREYGHLELHERLLELLGCAQMSRQQVEQHLGTLADVFDAAQAHLQTPFPFASDISAVARPIAIDGSRELIEAGYHREALFWMAVTYSRCQVVLHHDAPAQVQERFYPGYRHLLGDLGINSVADLQARSAMTEAVLPQLWQVTEAILAANPAIEE